MLATDGHGGCVARGSCPDPTRHARSGPHFPKTSPATGRYLHVLGVSDGTIDAVPGCDGLTITVAEFWAEIDQLDDG
jgi:hypothetical protein